MGVDSIVVAAHTDIMGSVLDRYRVKGETRVFERRHADILRAGGVNVFCDHLGGDSRYGYAPATGLKTDPLQRAMRLFDHAHLEARESDSLVIATSVADIRKAVSANQFAMVLGMEGGSPLQGELSFLRAFYRMGLRSLGLTHNWRNSLADGCLERSGGGLTHFGTAVLRECNDLGIVVDVSHMARAGVRDALDATTAPIIASHTNPQAVRDHPHNLPDELLKGIADSGGFIGVFVLNTYLSDSASPKLSDVTAAIGHLIDVAGIDHVGLAPDIMENWNQAEFKAITEGASTFESVPVMPIEYVYPEGLSSVGQLNNLRAAIDKDLQLTQDEVDKIFGGNCLRAYERAWGA